MTTKIGILQQLIKEGHLTVEEAMQIFKNAMEEQE